MLALWQNAKRISVGRPFLVVGLLCCCGMGQVKAEEETKQEGFQQKKIEGWTVWVSDELTKQKPEKTAQALELLQAQLQGIVKDLPEQAVKFFRTVPLWMTPVPEGARPTAEYHPDAGWLRSHNRSTAMAQCIQFSNIDIFEKENRRMPRLVLHELAHAYHHQVLKFDHPAIVAAFKQAVDGKGYEQVKFFDGSTRKHYALSNAKEYFAESTEAYFGANDFFPFNRQELQDHDPEMCRLLAEIWKASPEATPAESK